MAVELFIGEKKKKKKVVILLFSILTIAQQWAVVDCYFIAYIHMPSQGWTYEFTYGKGISL